MDNQQLIAGIKSRFNHAQSKLYLQEKYSSQLWVIDQGGRWPCTPQFIAYLKHAPEYDILLDSYEIPLRVNTTQLLERITETRSKVMSEWLEEYTKCSVLR